MLDTLYCVECISYKQRFDSRWVDNIKMDLREIGWDGMD
jgi:hypothetical protein